MFASQASTARFHIEHIAQDTNPVPYWHVQELIVSELSLLARRGLSPGFGAELVVPWRAVPSKIRYQDIARQPYTPIAPDTHHRNETLRGLGDPRLSLLAARPAGAWTIGARAGITVPFGKTEPNPFELGRLGLRHQHVQFGTGTWDPLLGAGAARKLAAGTFAAGVLARLPFAENSHGYRAGPHIGGAVTFARPLGAGFGGSLGTEFQHEWAEKWEGRLEEEGNLGRTDVLVALGLSRTFARLGTLSGSVRLPLYSRAHGEQADYPVIYSLGIAR